MIRNDQRTESERGLRLAVVMTDRFMSGWGEARNGLSYAAWACTAADLPRVLAWVKSRSDASRVRVVANVDKYRPKGAAHLTIYGVSDGHPATSGEL